MCHCFCGHLLLDSCKIPFYGSGQTKTGIWDGTEAVNEAVEKGQGIPKKKNQRQQFQASFSFF
jgi:hypothetical protein